MSQRSSRSVRATRDGLKLLHTARAGFEDGTLTHSAIAERLNISDKTVARFLRGEKADLSNALAIVNLLKLNQDDVLSLADSLVGEAINKIENSDTADSERAQKLIEELETSLNTLNQAKEIDFQAMGWLKANRQSLSKEAAEVVLKRLSSSSTDTAVDASELELFSQDIKKHLQALYLALEEGDWEVVDRAIKDRLIPINREVKHYTEALSFIRDQKISPYLLPEVAQCLILCFDYLIAILPVKF